MAGAEINEHFVVDISIGQHWGKYWADNGLSGITPRERSGRIAIPMTTRKRNPIPRVVVLSDPRAGRISRVVAGNLYRGWQVQKLPDGKCERADAPSMLNWQFPRLCRCRSRKI